LPAAAAFFTHAAPFTAAFAASSPPFITTSSRSFLHSSYTKMSASATNNDIGVDKHEEDDPYIYLEEVESETSIAFAKHANDLCLKQLGDPSDTETYRRVLAALESDERQVHHIMHMYCSMICLIGMYRTNHTLFVVLINDT